MKGETEFLILDPFVPSLNPYSKLFVIASPAENVICTFLSQSVFVRNQFACLKSLLFRRGFLFS